MRLGLARFPSSIRWSQAEEQAGSNTWSWPVARAYFLDALTGATEAQRETAFARTLRTIGHLTHLVQDATVPAHVRNDSHISIELSPNPFVNIIKLNPDWYEDWVTQARLGDRIEYRDILRLAPTRPGPDVFGPTDDVLAPVPVSGLIDTDPSEGNLRLRALSGPSDVGLAELVNPNFLSRDTIFQSYVHPRIADLGPGFLETVQPGKWRQYFPLLGASGAVELGRVVAESTLYDALGTVVAVPPNVAWTLADDRISEAYARELIPRAIGYSAALIDYFFRGRLDVDVFDNVADGEPAHLRIQGTNASTDALGLGRLTLYADDALGQRVALRPVSGLESDTAVSGVPVNGDLTSTWFEAPEGAERFVAVYRGDLGGERAAASFPGGVIGKVLGGVRVEHVFADGETWKIRTPAGVFTLPLSTLEYEEVKWGDGADVLVARTMFGEGMPNRVRSFTVSRRTGSIDLLVDAGGLLDLTPVADAEVPFGLHLGTNVAFAQTIHYRQRLARVNPVIVNLVGNLTSNNYDVTSVESPPPGITEVVTRQFAFDDVFALGLDPAHNVRFNGLGASRYLWDLWSVTGDADGRLLGLVQVLLMDPPLQPATVDFLGLDHITGELETQATARVRPFMPTDVGPVWMLVDLRTREIVASTVGPEIAIASEVRVEAPPFGSSDAVSLVGFEQPNVPGVWVKIFENRVAGPFPGFSERLWVVLPADPLESVAGVANVRADVSSDVGIQSLGATGLRRGDLAGVAPVTTAVDVARKEQIKIYFLVDVVDNVGTFDAFRAITLDGTVAAPVRFYDARMHGGGVPKLALLGQDDATAGGAAHVIAWDHARGVATVVADLPPGSHGLTAATSSAALVTSFVGEAFDPAGFIVQLDAPKPPLAFIGQDFWPYTLLEPRYLYNMEDTRFYRVSTPLRRTALPAPLASPAPSFGDYHAIRVP
ncbi:MAG: hypothetical protein FJ027_06975 [Candidatus Rokubacteria bacterium]|nr:hypothetical protein [Candidatus Rokubacteria bacterium]